MPDVCLTVYMCMMCVCMFVRGCVYAGMCVCLMGCVYTCIFSGVKVLGITFGFPLNLTSVNLWLRFDSGF